MSVPSCLKKRTEKILLLIRKIWKTIRFVSSLTDWLILRSGALAWVILTQGNFVHNGIQVFPEKVFSGLKSDTVPRKQEYKSAMK